MERIIKKSITRTINTAQYENLILTVSVEEQLKAKSEKDMNKKISSLIDKLISDYKETEIYAKLLEQLNKADQEYEELDLSIFGWTALSQQRN